MNRATSARMVRRNRRRIALALLLTPLYVLSFLFPRNRKLWVFGNRHGFIDNSRYLFEYVCEKCPDVTAVWVAHEDEVLQTVAHLGFRSVHARSLRGILTILHAGVGVVSNGLGDLNRFATGGMFLVQLWHATPIKRILLDSPLDIAVGSGYLGQIASLLYRRLFKSSLKAVKMAIASSPVAAERMRSAFGLRKEDVIVTGVPRADIILRLATETARPLRLKKEPTEYLILFAPTWREDGSEPWETGFDPDVWEQLLSQQNARFMIRLHPLAQSKVLRASASGSSRISLMDLGEHPDINVILSEVDLLITDYSSVATDFALLGRPIVFFAPDYTAYAGSRGLYEPFEEYTCNSFCSHWNEVYEAVRACVSGSDERYRRVAKRINQRFNSYTDTRNCERIVHAIRQRVRANLGSPR